MENCVVYMSLSKEISSLDQVLLHWDITHHFSLAKVADCVQVSHTTHWKQLKIQNFMGFYMEAWSLSV